MRGQVQQKAKGAQEPRSSESFANNDSLSPNSAQLSCLYDLCVMQALAPFLRAPHQSCTNLPVKQHHNKPSPLPLLRAERTSSTPPHCS